MQLNVRHGTHRRGEVESPEEEFESREHSHIVDDSEESVEILIDDEYAYSRRSDELSS